MGIVINPEVSLFDLVDASGGQQLFTNHRASLVRISYEIENGILNGAAGTRIFAGFQKLSFFLPHQQRYQRMTELAESIWVFGVPDVPPPNIPGVNYILLSDEDRLTQEWFLVAEGPDYFSALVAKDLSGFETPNPQRLFNGIWTFDEAVVRRFQGCLSHWVEVPPLDYAPQQRNYESQIFYVSRIASDLIHSLEQRNEELQRTQQLREQLLRMLVHDLRNPLGGIMGYVDLIERAVQRGGDREEILEFIERARIGNNQLNILIENILDLNRLQAGEFPVKKQLITLAPLFEQMQSQFSGMAQMNENTLQVALSSPDLTVAADRNTLTRVLSNLLSNAIRHTRQGKVRLEARRDKQKGHTLMSVIDTGEGIPADELPRVFDLYYQGENRRTKGAAGLGLTFCKQAVEAQGGVIWVESEIGKGSAFHIRLPRM